MPSRPPPSCRLPLALLTLAAVSGCVRDVAKVDVDADAGTADAADAATSDATLSLDDRLSALARDIAKATCDRYVRCGEDWMPDPDACEVYVYAETMNSTMATASAAVAAGLQALDPKAGPLCLEALNFPGCGLVFDCGQFTVGVVPLGGVCRSHADCAEGECGSGTNVCPSICALPVVTEGDDCTQVGCVDGLYCDYASQVCLPGTPRVGLGEHCGFDPAQSGIPGFVDCEADLYCTDTDLSVGICATPPTAGAPCKFADPCADGLSCIGREPDATCGEISRLGGPCVAARPDEVFTEGCEGGLACVDGKCVLPPSEGPCGPDAGAPCDAFHRCDQATSTCQPLRENGEACDRPGDCYSLNCEEGRCTVWAGFCPP